MAHFAKINENKEVLTVNVVDNENATDEATGQAYLEIHSNWPANMWIQTSYNTQANEHRLGGTPFRGNYAGVGSEWDDVNQIFWLLKPHSSWIKHIDSASWKSPIGDAPVLTSEQTSQNEANTHIWVYVWNEDGQTWDLTDIKE
tara:strand:+ start:502 stop:933 length:432 start_codon:yes stop_codon:yes gene_type:complete